MLAAESLGLCSNSSQGSDARRGESADAYRLSARSRDRLKTLVQLEREAFNVEAPENKPSADSDNAALEQLLTRIRIRPDAPGA